MENLQGLGNHLLQILLNPAHSRCVLTLPDSLADRGSEQPDCSAAEGRGQARLSLPPKPRALSSNPWPQDCSRNKEQPAEVRDGGRLQTLKNSDRLHPEASSAK